MAIPTGSFRHGRDHRCISDQGDSSGCTARDPYRGLVRTPRAFGILWLPRDVGASTSGEPGRGIVSVLERQTLTNLLLQADIKPILEELFPILFDRVYALLATSATGTDEAILQSNMKKGYLSFLQTIFTDELQDMFLSDRESASCAVHQIDSELILTTVIDMAGNKPRLDGFINHLLSIATDKSERSDRSAQKAAIFLLMRTIQTWAAQPGLPTAFLTEAALLNRESKKQTKVNGTVVTSGPTGSTTTTGQVVPGYETVAYERILPAMFQTILDPEFKAKDGQAGLVSRPASGDSREIRNSSPFLLHR